ncbi:M3 family oligoendopeptidase [Longirhabdus pacifica]|uniref:M3 family oligoendopeptidase n=1 Tax=Longirhabdus pacifica TaxID=2305227 RepID=UPI001008F44F|nr:M3 family oligoendopeptidase [Longirhabdus pacifica]
MNFSQYKYQRPSEEDYKQQCNSCLKNFEQASSANEQSKWLQKLDQIRSHAFTMYSICSARHSIDTQDAFYKEEQDYMNTFIAVYYIFESKLSAALCNTPYKEELIHTTGEQRFRLAQTQVNTTSEEIIPLLQQENKLINDYHQLIASAKISLEGKELTLSELIPFEQSPDRSIRKKASQARFEFYAQHEETFDSLFDELVQLRTSMAKQLGYKNFVELGYNRMKRTDYDADRVAKYRKQIEDNVVPLVTKLYEKQRKRTDIEKLKYYDLPYRFKSGNATPKGSSQWIINNGMKMYEELSEETHEFFNFMKQNQLMDLESKPGKQQGGYCTFFPNYKAPFIFANFSDTSDDIYVLTHEAGHAFQCYMSRHYNMDYIVPTYEACEIHSMSMEFFTWPWMELFFKEDTNKYKYAHLTGAITVLTHIALVDEFQHIIYEKPELTPQERKDVWRELEQKYTPHVDYDDNSFLLSGGYWHKIGHIYFSPFYYIDYALAQVCALQFWKKMQEDRESAWEDYVNLCKQGGRKSFLELLDVANLTSPFEDGCLENIVKEAEAYLDSIDDQAL